MARDIPSSILSELSEEVVYPFFAVDLYFDSGTLRVWSGYGDFIINEALYLGAGQLLNISAVEETTEIEAKGASITMTGIPSAFLSLALDEPYQGRECKIYFGFNTYKTINTQSDNEITTQLLAELYTQTGISNMVEIFSGELDQMNIEEHADTCTIAVTAENILIKLERPVVRRFTSQDQKSRYPNDKGLDFIASLQDKEIFWGRKASK